MVSGAGDNAAHSIAQIEPERFFAFKECQDLLKSRLTKPWLDLFAEVAGLPLHVCWHDPLEFENSELYLSLCPAAQEMLKMLSAGQRPFICQTCDAWGKAERVQLGWEEQRFIGSCGLMNCTFSFRPDTSFPPLVTLVLQTGVGDHPVPFSRKAKPRVSPPRKYTSSLFDQAVALLRMRIFDLGAAVNDWYAARRELEKLRESIRGTRGIVDSPAPPAEERQPAPVIEPFPALPVKGRGQQVVREMLEHIHNRYHRPLSLSDVAAEMKMNCSYLSTLFSQTLGITFHRYVQEFRLAKAKEMLRNPRWRISEVAAAVGYSGADQFRHVFKARLGVSPATWRLIDDRP